MAHRGCAVQCQRWTQSHLYQEAVGQCGCQRSQIHLLRDIRLLTVGWTWWYLKKSNLFGGPTSSSQIINTWFTAFASESSRQTLELFDLRTPQPVNLFFLKLSSIIMEIPELKGKYTQEEKKQLLANLDIEGISPFFYCSSALCLIIIVISFNAYSRTSSPPIWGMAGRRAGKL